MTLYLIRHEEAGGTIAWERHQGKTPGEAADSWYCDKEPYSPKFKDAPVEVVRGVVWTFCYYSASTTDHPDDTNFAYRFEVIKIEEEV